MTGGAAGTEADALAAFFAGGLWYRDKSSSFGMLPGKQYPSLLEQLPESCYTIGQAVLMSLNAVLKDLPILLVDIPTREDMRRGEGRGCLHAMNE